MNTTPALEIIGLEKHYPRFKLGPVSLTVAAGTIYGLIGPNGAGKSTLIDSIFGMTEANGGQIKVCGLDHSRDELAVKQRTAYMGPELSYAIWGTVGRAIRFVRGFRPTWDEAYATALMQKLGLQNADKIATMSFGGRTKLALLLALAWKPTVLILDEPTTGLDAHAKALLFSELLAIVKDEQRSVLISSHQITDLERFADRIGVLHQGQMVAEGIAGELVERFVQVSFSGPARVDELPGLTVLAREGDRCRAVLDTQLSSLSALAERGAADVSQQAQTLEDLFLALTR